MSEKAKEILKSIQDKKIKPTSRWKIILKDYLIWILFVIVTLVGAVAMSVIIFIIRDNDWDIYSYLNKTFLGYFILLLPYFWLVILFILGALAYFNFKNTRKGYLLNPYWVVIGSVLISVILGWILFEFKVGGQIDRFCAEKIPYYKGTETYKKIFWSNPENGLLSGEIVELIRSDEFVIRDFSEKRWNILGNDVIWKSDVNKELGERVKVMGVFSGENNFIAKEVRPWSCQCNECKEMDSERTCLGNNQAGKSHSCSK